MNIKKFYLPVLIALLSSTLFNAQEIRNFSPNGEQITRFDEDGNAVDAHDGKISYFNGTFYLYGTSYGCGFEWGNEIAPFCGFKSYSSKDLIHWGRMKVSYLMHKYQNGSRVVMEKLMDAFVLM